MTGSSYQLSCDEQQDLKQRVVSALRVQRLKEVRAQDRQLAKQRARAYKDLCVDSAQQLQTQLISLITQQRETELAVLQAQYEEALAGLASAQQQAAETEEELALQEQQKHQLYLQRQAEAQERFNAALAQVRNARQSELQAVLDRVQRRQHFMAQERGKAQGFTEQAKEAAAQQAQRQAQMQLQEEQRRRQNKVSRIDFKYSRLHELGVPHLVVNHRGLPQQGPDAASQAQLEADRLLGEQQTQAQQQQENARKAADRGVSAQRLLQAEQNRRRMEQALQELESNELQQRKQDLAPDKLTAAPLLRKWHKQKLQAKARLAFERDFLPGAAPAGQQGLPSFVAYGEVATPQQQQQQHPGQEQRPQSAAQRPATAADRALKLVQELERQRRAEAAAAAAEQQQRAADRSSGTASSVDAEENDVPVDDLITFIPPVRSPDGRQQPPTPSLAPEEALDAAAAAAMAAARAAGTGAGSEASRSSTSLTAMLDGDQHTSTASVLQESAPSLSASDSLGPSMASYSDGAAAIPAAAAADASLRSSLQEQQQEAGASDSSAGVLTVGASEVSDGSTNSSGSSPAAAAAAAVQGRAAEGAAPVLGSRDSLDAIIAAADEVLRQLPADMQAAAAARAAAAAAPVPRPQQQQGAGRDGEALRQSAASSSGLRMSAEQVLGQAGPRGRPADSSAEAATILAELSALQQQLGLQVLNSQSSDSALGDLQSFGADVDRFATAHLSAQLSRAQHAPAGSAAAGGSAGAVEALRASAAAAAASAGLSEALDGARQQLQAAAGARQQQQGQPELPVRTELDDLIDRILAPDYPSNILPGPLAGPMPSTFSPTRPSRRSGRPAAAQDSSRQQEAQSAASVASAAAAAAAAATAQAAQSSETELFQKLRALGMELQGLGMSSAAAGPTGSGAAAAWPRGSLEGSASTSSLTLPTTILEATAQAQQRQGQPQQAAPVPMGRPPRGPAGAVGSSAGGGAGATDSRQRLPSVSVSTSAPSLSGLLQRARETLAAAAAAGHPDAAAAGRGLAVPSSLSASSDSTWSLTASQEASLLSLEQMLAASVAGAAPAASTLLSGVGAAAPAAAGGFGLQQELSAGLPLHPGAASSVMPLPSTLLRGAPAQPSQAGSSSSAAAQAATGLGSQPSAAAAAAQQDQEQDTYELLRGLLSLSGSSSPRSPSSGTGAAAQTQLGAQEASGGQMSASVSSALSSMSDRELETLLQRAMAATGFSAAASAAAGGEAGTSGSAPAAAGDGAWLGAGAEGSAGDIEAALEAMLAAGPPASTTQQGLAQFDQASVSTTLPSTILRVMQQQQGRGMQQAARQQASTPAAAAAAAGPSRAASALQRAKHSSRARAAETASASGSSVVSATDSGSNGAGSMSDTERSTGDTDSGSSGSLSIPQTLGLAMAHGDFRAVGSSSMSIAGFGADGGSSSLSLPSTVQHAMADVPGRAQQQATAGAGQWQHLQPAAQQQQAADEARGAEGVPLAPIQEEDEASSSMASELLSASTQEIDALLSRLAEEQRQAGIATGTGSDTSETISGTSSSTSADAGHPPATTAATAGRGAHAGGSGSSGSGLGASGGTAGASSSRQDTLMSSDSFSEVVSSLMLHIDSTIASLAAGTTAAGADTSSDRGASGEPVARGSQPSRRPGDRPQQQQAAQAQEQQLPLPSFSFGASSSSSGFSSAMAGTPAGPVARAPAGAGRAPAAAGGGDSSSSAAGLSDGLGSSLGFSGVSSNTPTDSSTQRYVQQVLLGVLSSSTGATGTTAATGTTGSPDVEAVSSRRQHDASTAAAAAAGGAGAGSGQAGAGTSAVARGSRQHPNSAAAAATAAAGPRHQQQQRRQDVRPAGAPMGGLLSPESTGATESVSVSSGDTDELLEGVSSGSVTIGPTSSSSSAGSGAQQHQADAAAAAAHRAQQQQQWPQPGAAGRGGQGLPGADVRIAPRAATAGAGSSIIDTMSPAMQGTSGTESSGPGFGSFEGLGVDGSGSVTAITSALQAAAEVPPSGVSFGELLSPDSSSASEGASRGLPHAAATSIAAAAAAGVEAAGSSRAAAGGMRGAGVSAVPVRPQAPQQQQQQQGAGGGVGRPVGLAGLLADIMSDDPVLARQLQQQQR